MRVARRRRMSSSIAARITDPRSRRDHRTVFCPPTPGTAHASAAGTDRRLGDRTDSAPGSFGRRAPRVLPRGGLIRPIPLLERHTLRKSALSRGGAISLGLSPYPPDYRAAFDSCPIHSPPPHRLAFRFPSLAGGRRAYHVLRRLEELRAEPHPAIELAKVEIEVDMIRRRPSIAAVPG